MLTRRNLALSLFLVCLVQMALPVPAQALFLDTNTGLQWLEFNASRAGSYNDITSQMGPGGAFEGFRYATSNEVLGLFMSQGVPDIGAETAANFGPVTSLLDALGALDGTPQRQFSYARTGTPPFEGATSRLVIKISGDRPINCSYNLCTAFAGFAGESWGDHVGLGTLNASWLVSTTVIGSDGGGDGEGGGGAPVPEPATLLLFGSGLAGLSRWRKVRQS